MKKDEKCEETCCTKNHHKHYQNGAAGGLYFVGFIGASVYYISVASGFWLGVLGFLKATVWPAFLVYGLLKYLGM